MEDIYRYFILKSQYEDDNVRDFYLLHYFVNDKNELCCGGMNLNTGEIWTQQVYAIVIINYFNYPSIAEVANDNSVFWDHYFGLDEEFVNRHKGID